MKQSLLLTFFNILIINLFGQMPVEDLYHLFELDEDRYGLNTPTKPQLKHADRQRLNFILSELYYNSDMQWSTAHKQEYVYDDKGNQILSVVSGWDSQQWTPNYKLEYTYDDNRNRTSRLYSLRNTAQQWVPYFKHEYSYDDNENQTLIRISIWETDTQQWRTHSKDEYAYDDNGKQIFHVISRWDSETQEWDPYFGYDTYIYDNDGNLTSRLRSAWDNHTQQWLLDQRYEYTYDTNGNFITYLTLEWNRNVQQWTPTHKENYIYDNSYTYNNLVVPFSENFFRHKRVKTIFHLWKKDLQEWMEYRRADYHYSEQTVGITSAIEAGIQVFPNPTNDLITFDLKNSQNTTVILHDAQGKHIGTQDLQDKQLSVGHLNSGIYFYQLLYDGDTYGGKFIVK